MILSFRCKHTQHLFYAEHSRRFARIQDVALRKLRLLAAADKPPVRTAVDQVPLGKTGLKLSRLGFGTGSNSGNVQKGLGQQTFNSL